MNSKNRQKSAEFQHALLRDRESEQPIAGVRRKISVPGGNPNLPVSDTLLSPSSAGFWEEDMPSYILSILDETVTNGYQIDGILLLLLSDDTELAQKRRRLAVLALIKAGAVEVV